MPGKTSKKYRIHLFTQLKKTHCLQFIYKSFLPFQKSSPVEYFATILVYFCQLEEQIDQLLRKMKDICYQKAWPLHYNVCTCKCQEQFTHRRN